MSDSIPPPRVLLGFEPLDQLLGGGLPRGAVALVTGAEGVGKSTLLAHCAHGALYVACDEEPGNVLMRVRRVSLAAHDAPSTTRAAVSLGEVLRALAATRASVVLVDGAQELGRPVVEVVRALAQAVRAAGAVALVAFMRGSDEAEHEADAVLRVETTERTTERRVACAKDRHGRPGAIVMRLTSTGFAPPRVAP